VVVTLRESGTQGAGQTTAVREIRIRPVGFRDATEEDLAALHAVEVPVELERGSNRMPRSLDAYVAFARNLPSAFQTNGWLAEAVDGGTAAAAGAQPVGLGYCWSHADGDPQAMECDVLVLPSHRRQGLGTRLFDAIAARALDLGRPQLTWSTFDRVPAGEPFSRRLGGRVARVNRESELDMARLDASLVGRWSAAAEAHALGYTLEAVDGPMPEHLRGDAATFHHIMQTAPRDDLEVADVHVDAAFVAEHDRMLVESGRRRWTVFVRDRTGACVGGTEVTFDPSEPDVAFQGNTGIDPAHRGHGLAKWVKAAVLERLRAERPDVRRVRTGNAFSNAPMLAINDALGFRVVSTRTEWQLRLPR
jgi:mycothiol synthase